jgi:dTDP-4-dehydrorhamnose 3,5-epimerase
MLKGMKKKKLTIIKSNDGSVMHALKKNEDEFISFGEAYFSTINYNSIKAWKLHTKMTLNLVVPVGEVLFCLFDDRESSSTSNNIIKIILSEQNYYRLTVPPKIWFGFKGVSKGTNLILNVADMIHDNNEILRKDLDEISVDWFYNKI